MSDALRAELVQLTKDLVSFPSVVNRPEQVHAAADYIAAYLEKIPNIHWERVESNGVPSLVATLRPTRSPKLFINGHFDVVDAKDEQWTPVERDGRIYGRGSQDMKASLAVMLRLLKDLAASENPPDVGFQFVGDEEIGGLNSTKYLLDTGWLCDFFIAAEPTDLGICYAQKAATTIYMHLPGQPSHGARPWDGHNPTFDFARGLLALEKHFPVPSPDSWQTTAVPSLVHTTGTAPNQVPPGMNVTIDTRRIAEDSLESILERIQASFPTAQITPPRPGELLNTDPNDPFVQSLAKVTSSFTKHETRLFREHFASDARFYSEHGIPSVCFGPIGAGLHSNDEWVDIASLEQLYDIFQHFITA